MSELRGRGGDREQNRPDHEHIPEPQPDSRATEPDHETSLPDWADRLPPEVRRNLAADEASAGRPHTSPRRPAEPEPDRAAEPRQPSATPTDSSDAADDDESHGTDPSAVREGPESPPELSRPQLSAKLREQMANNAIFARAGWGQEDYEADVIEPRDQTQPRATSGSRSSTRAQEPTAKPPAEQQSANVVDVRSPRSDSIGDRSTDSAMDRTDDSGRERRTDAELERRTDVDDGAETPEHEFVEDAEPRAMDAYRRIRVTDDVDAVATNGGFPHEVVEVAKDNLFIRTHDVAVAPGVVRHGNFTPDVYYSDLWDRVASGAELTGEERSQFWSLLAHEYVEAKLMEAGLPYKSAEPGAWDEYGSPVVSREFPTAHTVAPKSLQSRTTDLLGHWKNLDLPGSDLRVAEDLSNLDEVVRVAKGRLGL